MPVTTTTVKYHTKDRVAWVTLNRPEAMNALNSEIRDGINQAIADATGDDDILVIVMTSEGGRAFSAGADLKQSAQRDASGTPTTAESRLMYGAVAAFLASSSTCSRANTLKDIPRLSRS